VKCVLTLRIIFIVAYSLLVLWSTNAVMRESDQASVIEGSIRLADDGDILGRSFYNYDTTYGTYWLLSATYKILGVSKTDAVALVEVGNYLAACVFLAGLVPLFILYGPHKWLEWVVVLSCLLCPVFLFSAPLLSSNVMSAGFIFATVMSLRARDVAYSYVLLVIFGFMAVACRADAVFIMPLLAFLCAREENWISVFHDKRVWLLAATCIVALVLGDVLCVNDRYRPALFFNVKLFFGYLIFSMNSALIGLLLLVCGLLWIGWKRKKMYPFILVCAVLIPLLFYGRLLYSPRHLMTTIIAILLTLFFRRGCDYWANIYKNRCGKVVVSVMAFGIAFSSFLGVSLSCMKSGKLVTADSTLYPTADGLWPMGANSWFLAKLAHAADDALDHNQRVWGAWTSISYDSFPSEDIVIVSNGLVSYGSLRMAMLGRRAGTDRDSDYSVLIDGRSVLRGLEAERQSKVSKIAEGMGNAVNLSQNSDAGIFLISQSNADISERWSILQCVKEVTEGDDFELRKGHASWQNFSGDAPYKWLVILEVEQHKAFEIWNRENSHLDIKKLFSGEKYMIYGFESKLGDEVAKFENLPENVWIAKSAMASFMQRKNLR